MLLGAVFFGTLGASQLIYADSYGVLNKKAPSWTVDSWVKLPYGKHKIDVKDFQGKVIYLYFFQAWCPGCHAHGFPTIRKLIKHYRDNNSVDFVAIQTAFEGFHTNTPEAAKETAEKYFLKIPIGHSGSEGKPSKIMRSYRSGGTPWTVIIDQKGNVVYNDFHIRPYDAIDLIDRLITLPSS